MNSRIIRAFPKFTVCPSCLYNAFLPPQHLKSDQQLISVTLAPEPASQKAGAQDVYRMKKQNSKIQIHMKFFGF